MKSSWVVAAGIWATGMALSTSAAAAVVVTKSTVELRAFTNIYGSDTSGVPRENYHATVKNSSGEVTDVGVTPAGLAPAASTSKSIGLLSQSLMTTGLVSLDAQLSSKVSGSCDWYCSDASGTANAFGYLEFKLDDLYTYELSQALEVNSASGYWSGTAGFDLYSLTSSKVVDSGSLALTEKSGSSGTSLLKTGLLGPGLYYLSLGSSGSSTTPYSTSGGFDGLFNFDFKLSAAPAPVPLPAAAWLLLSGLGGIAAVARRRRVPLAA